MNATVLKAVGICISVTGIALVILDLELSLRHSMQPDRLAIYFGMGLAVVGAYIIAPTWLENLVAKVRSYLPGGGQPPAGTS